MPYKRLRYILSVMAVMPRLQRVFLAVQFFAARCMHKRGLCRRAVFVCPSVTFVYFVYCVETAKDTAIVAVECE